MCPSQVILTMAIKPVLTTLIALFSIILALYTIKLPSSRSSIATTIISSSQLGALSIHSAFFGHRHHLHFLIKSCEKRTSRLTHLYKASLVLTVDLHGCGNFSSVQSAIDAVPDLSSSKTLIIVNSGVYRSPLQLQALVLRLLYLLIIIPYYFSCIKTNSFSLG